ncbi:MAG: bifunctional phosphopantothenoylcysteine decarboxylase/phosphopantothenate--cysteine ligase CoaBC [Anaerolineales bacterium]
MSIFEGKHILLGVSGSIAAYKAADLASKLTQQGAQVRAILTPAAEKFITPLTFSSVTGQPAHSDADLWGGQAHILHVGLAHRADLMLIAPCSANTLASLAQGRAENLLTITALALGQKALCLAPAMDAGMYEHPATRQNVETLQARGTIFLGPQSGRMASGLNGLGRMMEAAEILGHLRLILGRGGKLAGRRLVISAGGSQEAIDPVRYLTNRSSGKQGYALAQAALDWGAQVTLISHPTALSAPIGAEFVAVRSAEEMRQAVLSAIAGADALIMAAAVADFQVKNPASEKLKKRDGLPQIELIPAPDILAEVASRRASLPRLKAVIGFAAESRDLLENAAAKLSAKKLDFIAANDISASDAGFSAENNRITLLFASGERQSLPLMSKFQAAEAILTQLLPQLES